MEKEEFISKARSEGYPEEYIAEMIRLHEDAAREGINSDYETDLIGLPIEGYPTSN